jgi:hypothetical protein
MEQVFGKFNNVQGNIIFPEELQIQKPARRWILTSLLNSSNFYGGPDAQPTPDGLLVRFGGMLVGPLENNKLFPCREMSPNSLFYLQHGEITLLCKTRPSFTLSSLKTNMPHLVMAPSSEFTCIRMSITSTGGLKTRTSFSTAGISLKNGRKILTLHL